MAEGKGRIRLPEVRRLSFDNGLRVIIMEHHKLPLVNFYLLVKAGATRDPKGKEGTANLVAALLRKGTKSRSAVQIAEEVDFIGAILRADANYDYTAISGEGLAKDADKLLEIFADIVRDPAFDEEEIERLRKQIIAEIEDQKDDPSTIANLNYQELLFGEHPYARPVIGEERSVKAITYQDIFEFYRRCYLPNNCILVAVGDFKSEQMQAKLKEKFGDWPASTGQMRSDRFPAPPQVSGLKLRLVDKSDVTQAQIRIGGVGIAKSNPDYFPVTVANTILGGGFTSRLVNQLRVARGLTYGASSSFAARLEPGPFVVSTFTKNQTALETIRLTIEELRKFKEEGATAEELDKAKNYLAGLFALRLQTPEAFAAQLAFIEFYGLPQDHMETYIDKIKAVSLQDVAEAARKYLPYPNLVCVVVSNASQVKGDLEKLGEVQIKSYLDDI